MKRSRGRPRVYTGLVRHRIGLAIRKYGLTHGLEHLKSKGINCSAQVALDVAEEKNITFKRGRPALAA